MNQGRVNVEELDSPLFVSLKRGGVFGSAAQADVAVRQVGLVRLTGLSAPSKASVGAGRVELAYAQDVVGDIQAETWLGRIRVQLPYGSLMDDASSTTVGRTRSAVPHIDGHPTRLVAKTTVGSVQVRTDLSALTASLQEQAAQQDSVDEARGITPSSKLPADGRGKAPINKSAGEGFFKF